MLAAQIGDRNAGLVLLQNPDDLFFRKTTALHALVLVVGQSELQPGLSQRGNVTVRNRFGQIQARSHLGAKPRGPDKTNRFVTVYSCSIKRQDPENVVYLFD